MPFRRALGDPAESLRLAEPAAAEDLLTRPRIRTCSRSDASRAMPARIAYPGRSATRVSPPKRSTAGRRVSSRRDPQLARGADHRLSWVDVTVFPHFGGHWPFGGDRGG